MNTRTPTVDIQSQRRASWLPRWFSGQGLALLGLALLQATATGGAWCDTYWPLHSGDYKTFRYGTKTLGLSVGYYSDNEFQLSYSSDEDSGYEIHQKLPAAIYLTRLSVNGGWIKISFDPDVLLFDESLLESGGSRITSTAVSQTGGHYSAVFTVKVSKAGTVTVPAGTFFDCRSVTVTEKATVPGQGTVTASALTAVLAPKVGMIKKLIKPGTWSVLESGMVGGVDVRTMGGGGASTLTLQVNGDGKLSPDLSGKSLTVGNSYTITAIPAKGYVFSHWDGSVSSTTPKLSFAMQENLVLQAYFVPNPFMAVKGSYSGLMMESQGALQRSAGSVTVTVTDMGAYSGALLLGGMRYTMSGQFDSAGQTTASAKSGKASPLALSLQLDLASSTDRLTGTVSDGGWTAVIDGDRAVFDGKSQIAGTAGQYTLIIAGSSTPAIEPGGDGYGTAKVDAAGRVRFAGSLADGTKFSQSATVSKNGEWPLYVSISKGQGMLVSWLQFANTASEDLSGEAVWSSQPSSSAKFYPAGFAISTTVSGSHYVPPLQGNNALGLADARVQLTGGNLALDLSQELVLDSKGKVTNLNSKEISLSLISSSGLCSGRMSVPSPGKAVSFKGVVLQKQKTARGYFLGADQSGQFWLGPN